ncbi:MAG: acetyl/propionyl/methylcrotonyl-CoA carboxylase subunit alpha [Pseudomonadota bacterium]
MIRTLLIANRGEIACRIARTARSLGLTPVAVHSDADAGALHVREIGRSIRLGPAPAAESYLDIEAVLEAARRAGADAVHPGYGFLSETPAFAEAVEAAGLIFIGPTPETLARFGDKASAKQAAIAAGVPVVPGSEKALSDPEEIAAAARRMGLPVLLKAAGGGGGRGQRLAASEDMLAEDIDSALREARSAFASEGLLLERFLPETRHVEVQIAGDGKGHVIHLHERDCTLQRRRQKVIEEAPAPGLSETLLSRLHTDAVRLGESLSYRGLGTVEFLVSGDSHHFLEVNPRLQVEHPVTEAITGLDLVALQLAIAQGAPLPARSGLRRDGHAIEARLYAEDPATSFAPSTGRLATLSLPEGVRADTGVAAGDEVTPFYDPMIAKIIVHASDRAAALEALADALDRTAVAGVTTNRPFLAALARHPDVAALSIHTAWIDAHLDALTAAPEPPQSRLHRAAAAALFLAAPRAPADPDPWRRRDRFTGWRLGLGDPQAAAGQRVTLSRPGEPGEELRLAPVAPDGAFTVIDAEGPLTFALIETAPARWRLTHQGEIQTLTARVTPASVELDTPLGRRLYEAAPPLAHAVAERAADGVLASPLTGAIVRLLAAPGDRVAAGDTIAILESMKMEIPIKAPVSGRAVSIAVAEGDMVDRGQRVAEIAPEAAE